MGKPVANTRDQGRKSKGRNGQKQSKNDIITKELQNGNNSFFSLYENATRVMRSMSYYCFLVYPSNFPLYARAAALPKGLSGI